MKPASPQNFQLSYTTVPLYGFMLCHSGNFSAKCPPTLTSHKTPEASPSTLCSGLSPPERPFFSDCDSTQRFFAVASCGGMTTSSSSPGYVSSPYFAVLVSCKHANSGVFKMLLLLSCCATSVNVRHGFGLHQEQVPFDNLSVFGIISNISGFSSILSVAFSKTSFALTLLRLVTDRWMRWFIYGLVFVLNVTHYLSAIFFWVSCDPPAKTWNPTLDGECWPVSVTVNYSIFVGCRLHHHAFPPGPLTHIR